MVLKKRRSAPDDQAAAKEQAPGGENLSQRFSSLFGSSSGSSALSSFLAAGPSSGSSSSATPAKSTATPEWIRPSAPSATLDPAAVQRLAATKEAKFEARATSTGKKRSSSTTRGAVAEAAAPEEPVRKRRSPEELQERETRTLFVGNVPLGWEKPQLRKALRAVVGDKYTGQLRPIWFRAEPVEEKWQGNLRKIGSIKQDHRKDASDAKNAYVVLESPDDVNTVRHLVHGHIADERHVLRADGVGKAAKLQSFDRKRSVFVGNLPTKTSEADLRGVFAGVGEVDAVRVVRDRVAKACKGFAFVRFKERASVKAAMNLWGAELQGRPIRVMKVTEQEGNDSGAGGSSSRAECHHPAAKRINKKNAWSDANGFRKPRKRARVTFAKEARGAKAAKDKKKHRNNAKKAGKTPRKLRA